MSKEVYPVLPLKQYTPVFPNQSFSIDVGREFSIKAINVANEKHNGKLIIAIQTAPKDSELGLKDVYAQCSVVDIYEVRNKEDNSFQIFVKGESRRMLNRFDFLGGCYVGEVCDVVKYVNQLLPKTKETLKKFSDTLFKALELRIYPDAIKNENELSIVLDSIILKLEVSENEIMKLFSTFNPNQRLDLLVEYFKKNKKVGVKKEKQEAPKRRSDDIIEILRDKVEECGMPDDVKKIAYNDLRKLASMAPTASEYHVYLNYVEKLVELPWNKKTEDKIEIAEAQKILEEDHYGLDKVKGRIIEFLSVRKLMPENKSSILCLCGSPGTGKTSIGKSIARCMGRKFIRKSLGGVRDEAEIRGHRKTYVGAMTGNIMDQICSAGSKNPVFMLDEIDKISTDAIRGNPAAALLEVLDPEQNNSFVDHYLNVPFDLSDVLFICTANDISTIPGPLRDRMDIIDVPGYSAYDKEMIAKNYLVKRQKERNGLKDKNVSISSEALQKIITEYTNEAGVRSLERECGTIMRKLAVVLASGSKLPKVVKPDAIEGYLGKPKMYSTKSLDAPEVGVSTGMAWNVNGGSILFVESVLTPGRGDVKLTGSLGDVIKESAMTSYTWIKSNHSLFNIDFDVFKTNDVHIHFPEGATPKDGPSAGIAITASIISTLTGNPVNNLISSTGEITLSGRVLPIGGLKDKIVAAHRAGIRKIIFPEKNKNDLSDLPKEIKDDVEFVIVSKLFDALKVMFVENFKSAKADEFVERVEVA
jgi:ATP-dependent Lon protease